MLAQAITCGLTFLALAAASPLSGSELPHQRKSLYPRQANSTTGNGTVCAGNTAADRSVWCDYDINTNYYDDGPSTGRIREYWFELTNNTQAPDGVERIVLGINGSSPGPTIFADWGDTVRVHVINSLADNGTSIHFHGIRQNWTNPADGVVSVTQCPNAPGTTETYEWKATQYGSSWYHSHYALQAWDGVFGGIVIRGPATANYEEDLGSLFLTDWDHETADSMYTYAQTIGPPTMDTGLINGINTWDNGTVGSRWSTDFTPGSSYLLRLVNGAIDTHFDFSIDNHTLQVIAMDFVPIVPYYTNVLSIGIGQRYDVIVQANQSAVASDFWLRAVPDGFCSDNDNGDDIRGIIHYGGLPSTLSSNSTVCLLTPLTGNTSVPSTTPFADYATSTSCLGEPYASLIPYLSLDAAPSSTLSEDLPVTVGRNTERLFKWAIGGTSLFIEWDNPTALQVLNNATDFGASSGKPYAALHITVSAATSLAPNLTHCAHRRHRAPNPRRMGLHHHRNRPRHRPPHPPPRPRLLRPRPGHRDIRLRQPHLADGQPAPPRRHDAAGVRIPCPRFLGRQPGSLAEPLPYRLAHRGRFRAAICRASDRDRSPLRPHRSYRDLCCVE